MKHYILGAVAAASLAMFGAASAASLGMMTSRPGSIYYNEGTAIAKAANEAGINLTIQSATSPTQYLPFVSSGGASFAIANMQEANYAYNGQAWFDGKKHPNLRVAALIVPNRLTFFVRKDSDIKTIGDLKDKKMPDGYTAGKTILPLIEALYATAGLTRKDMTPVQVQSVVAGVNAFMAGDVDGFTFAMDGSIVKEAAAKVGGLRALPIPNTKQALDAMRKYWPTTYLTRIGPDSGIPGVEHDAYYMTYPIGILTNAQISDDDVYNLVRVLYEHKATLAASFPRFKDFEPKTEMAHVERAGGMAYHPGAIRFYKEVGIWPGADTQH